MRISEVSLDHAFADALIERSLQRWLLQGGRFAAFAEDAVLLNEEQSRRKAKHWWKHWWAKLPDGSESETDLFLVFDASGRRFALHIENKPADGKLLLSQAADYRRRATFMANQPKWLNYTDFETILLAPAAFLAHHEICTAQFDRAVSYEELAAFVPLFGEAVTGWRHLERRSAADSARD